MQAFFALLNHVFVTLSPVLHTPVMLIAEPAWTAKNHEDITQFIFEKFKTPALCIMDSALATSYAYGIGNAAVIDVGFQKVDVTAITDFQISGRGSVPNSGGDGMTRRLMELLKAKNFTRDMAEQLKRSNICEILAPGTPLPGNEAAAEEVVSNPAAAASTGATSSGPNVKISEAPRGPGPDTEVGDEDGEDDGEEKAVDDDGNLDIATIVTSGKTEEFLAKAEKEKEKKPRGRAGQLAKEAAEAAANARPVRLPNSKRPRAIFHYEEAMYDEPESKRQKTPEAAAADEPITDQPVTDAAPETTAPAPTEASTEAAPTDAPTGPAAEAPVEAPVEVPTEVPTESAPSTEADLLKEQRAAKKEEKRKDRERENASRGKRDIEIGIERFQAADNGYMDAIADTVYRTILSVDDVGKRQDAWEALIICGGGSQVRGFREALVATLNSRYIVSPSSATMFMSELPSNLATPTGTGSMTPTGAFPAQQAPPTASAVNPLLLAATTASHPALNPNMSVTSYNSNVQAHSSHSQSPTNIRVASPPTYFPAWKSYEDAVFLGSQVAAKVIFVTDQGLSKGFLSRVEFNEEGPSAIHQV
jgi:actin-related protein 9